MSTGTSLYPVVLDGVFESILKLIEHKFLKVVRDMVESYRCTIKQVSPRILSYQSNCHCA